jgi:hypothetical protein
MKLEFAPAEYQRFIPMSDAILYCFSLNIEGKTGWRLPTRNELTELHHETKDYMWCFAYCQNDDLLSSRVCWPVREMGA